VSEHDAQPVPEFYVDAVQLSTGVYGVALTFGLNPPHPTGPHGGVPKDLCVLRMSLEHAKVLAMLLRAQLKDYERENGEIPLPPSLYTSLGIAREDWGF
jgi:hypothetical protein